MTQDDSDELLAVYTQNILDESVVNMVQTVQSLGKDQYAKYCKEVITDRTLTIHEPIKKNALLLFTGKNSDLLNILAKDTQNNPPDSIDMKLLGGAAIMHLLPTANIVTFDENADQYGTHTAPAASKNPREKSEERVIKERLWVRTSSQETGSTSNVTRPTSKNSLHSFPIRLPQLFFEEPIDPWHLARTLHIITSMLSKKTQAGRNPPPPPTPAQTHTVAISTADSTSQVVWLGVQRGRVRDCTTTCCAHPSVSVKTGTWVLRPVMENVAKE
ncbi:hypothetical protein Hamer_G011222 [Homarus americanus]|uniref:Uncharacterized protein n=1 Tax=Homarus americanus TaxID=6706 RepID=A0A8J5MVW0_HOMAM|nr:hypothetical protein Hamer_G011222 [Homarus americanus]